MQIIKSFPIFFFFIIPFFSVGQSTYLPQGSRANHLMDRLEIRLQRNSDLNFSTLKPYSRKSVVGAAEQLTDSIQLLLSAADKYNLQSLFTDNSEWVSSTNSASISKKPVLKTFYKNKAHLYEVNNKDFFMAVNPVLYIRGGKELDYDKTLYVNARGLTLRGRIANKIGFSSTIVDHQERGPKFYQQQIASYRAVPGVGFYKVFKQDASANDYFDGRGYFTFGATKYIQFQLGYDKNFIGNGYRSLLLSDWGNSYLFAKINTRIWKFNYQNLFMELIPQYSKKGDTLFRRKYAAMHHLSMNVTPWLNLGLFEGVMFGRKDHFDFQYLNPVIFYRHIEGSIGSPDNAVAGFDFKANVLHRGQIYGQFLLDEFNISKIRKDPYNWSNKYGLQLGAKYMDVLGVKNLDLQVEYNRVRPFTYSHFDTINNYTHYNQPLAHPLGANFQEWVGIVRYQPFPKWDLYARAIWFEKGLDTGNANFGGNIFRSYLTRLGDSGFKLGGGNKMNCLNVLMNLSYEWKQNLFIEAGMQHRSYSVSTSGMRTSELLFNFGLRLNWFRKEYDF